MVDRLGDEFDFRIVTVDVISRTQNRIGKLRPIHGTRWGTMVGSRACCHLAYSESSGRCGVRFGIELKEQTGMNDAGPHGRRYSQKEP